MAQGRDVNGPTPYQKYLIRRASDLLVDGNVADAMKMEPVIFPYAEPLRSPISGILDMEKEPMIGPGVRRLTKKKNLLRP